MAIDVSFLKDIDFTNPDNLVFFAIFLVTVIIVLFIIGWIFAGIVRMIRRLIVHLFNIEVKKPKFDKKSTEWLHKEEVSTLQPKVAPVESAGPSKEEPKEKTEEAVTMPQPKLAPIEFAAPLKKEAAPKKKPEEGYKEKEQKTIKEGLAKLKAEGRAEEETLESKMPSREEKTEEEKEAEKFEPIKIPTPMHPSGEPESFAVSQDRANVVGAGNISIPQPKESGVADASMFGGKPEVSRIKLEHELRKDTKVWQAARQEGLTLSPAERAKLVKEVFSPTLGRNISKADLKLGIEKLNQKMLGAKSSAEHAKLRKEIKFFKKIGGIK